VSLLSAIAMLLVVVNLLRLVVAGSGAAPQLPFEQVREYRPALGPTIVLSMLAVLLAQPGQLPLWRDQLAAPLAAHREALLAQQQALAQELGQEPQPAFRAELAQSDFLAWRVREIWKAPQRAFVISALYWLLVLLPTLAGRFVALSALREYEEARWHAVRARVTLEGQRAARQLQESLAPYPSYVSRVHPQLAAPFEARRSFLSAPRPRQEPVSRLGRLLGRLRLRMPWRAP
jgi:hypothetical protein